MWYAVYDKKSRKEKESFMRPDDFPLELSYQRGKKGLTQKQLADALRVSDRSVKLWESGASLPRKGVRIRMAQEFDLPPTYFLLQEELPGTTAPAESAPAQQELQKLFAQLRVTLSDSDVSDDVKKSLSHAIETTIQKISEN